MEPGGISSRFEMEKTMARMLVHCDPLQPAGSKANSELLLWIPALTQQAGTGGNTGTQLSPGALQSALLMQQSPVIAHVPPPDAIGATGSNPMSFCNPAGPTRLTSAPPPCAAGQPRTAAFGQE
jgi:hypothetical protein